MNDNILTSKKTKIKTILDSMNQKEKIEYITKAMKEDRLDTRHPEFVLCELNYIAEDGKISFEDYLTAMVEYAISSPGFTKKRRKELIKTLTGFKELLVDFKIDCTPTRRVLDKEWMGCD